MIRRFTLVRRAERLSRDEFVEHWQGPHASLARELPGLRGYRLNTIVRAPNGFDWDGVAELWFDSIEAADTAFATEPLGTQLAEDSSHLLAQAVPFFVESITIVEPPEA